MPRERRGGRARRYGQARAGTPTVCVGARRLFGARARQGGLRTRGAAERGAQEPEAGLGDEPGSARRGRSDGGGGRRRATGGRGSETRAELVRGEEQELVRTSGQGRSWRIRCLRAPVRRPPVRPPSTGGMARLLPGLTPRSGPRWSVITMRDPGDHDGAISVFTIARSWCSPSSGPRTAISVARR